MRDRGRDRNAANYEPYHVIHVDYVAAICDYAQLASDLLARLLERWLILLARYESHASFADRSRFDYSIAASSSSSSSTSSARADGGPTGGGSAGERTMAMAGRRGGCGGEDHVRGYVSKRVQLAPLGTTAGVISSLPNQACVTH